MKKVKKKLKKKSTYRDWLYHVDLLISGAFRKVDTAE